MMYQNKLVVAVKVGGKILREFKELVKIPFGTEYSLLIKNLNSVRAQVRVSIDGKDVTEGISLVIPANGEMELERSILNGNFSTGNRFKFIERTAGIEQHRGVKAEDGLIRIEYQFEKQYTIAAGRNTSIGQWPWSQPYGPYWNGPIYSKSADLTDASKQFGDILNCVGTAAPATRSLSKSSGGALSSAANNVSFASGQLTSSYSGTTTVGAIAQSTVSNSVQTQNSFYSAPVQNETGITVPGSVSDQKFTHASWFAVESETHVMILHLVGELDNGQYVVTPVVVKAKQKCVSCGKVNKANAKFCSECGTGLDIQ